ncbi:MAG: ribosome small subunit-dependent GTPase A [Rhodobacteraceae bacterium]|nr:ribosome small subunit-dependent GTPase A [Paracoccaceae bacterium]
MTLSLPDLGWSAFFLGQCDADALAHVSPCRLTGIHRDRVTALGAMGPRTLTVPPPQTTGDLAVGDWVLADAESRVTRCLARQSLLSRRAAGREARVQLIAANVDALFVTSSCSADFNPARIERYLALAHEAGAFPVVVLTRADLVPDPESYRRRAEALARNLTVLTVDAHDPADRAQLAAWCPKGRTGALVGSSGAGKTTLLNGLTGEDAATAPIRDDDARGRHTTTGRALRPIPGAGLLIDTPGMRELGLHDAAEAIDAVFDDIAGLAAGCRFADCRHSGEPGCAVAAAVDGGTLDPDRLARWQKLRREDARTSESLAEARRRDRGFGRMVKRALRDADRRKGR